MSDAPHGTWARYNLGCRQECCREAARMYQKRRLWDAANGRPRRIPTRGARRRVQALNCLGWSNYDIARRAGVFDDQVRQWCVQQWMTPENFDLMARVYDEMSMELPPTPTTKGEKVAQNRTRNRAKRNGWAPPLAWDDIDNDDHPTEGGEEIAVDEMAVYRRINADHKVILNHLERREAIRIVHARNLSDAGVGAVLGYSDRTVFRVRQELGLPAYDPERQSA